MISERPKISVYIAASLDGFIARKDGNLDWLDRVGGYDEDYGFKKFCDSIDAVILGRKTYEVAAPAHGTKEWPYQGKKMVVLSNNLSDVIPEAQLYSGDLTDLVTNLYSDGIRHAWVDGGNTISQFLGLNLVDEVTISIIPILLGSGIPLFSLKDELQCQLISAQSYPSGLVQLQYRMGPK